MKVEIKFSIDIKPSKKKSPAKPKQTLSNSIKNIIKITQTK